MSSTALCSKVPDTTAQRELDRLRQALEQAEAASRAKSVLIAKLGHKLKTPLSAVVGFAQLMRSRGGREPQPVARSMAGSRRSSASAGTWPMSWIP
ncbi:hypothetical protein [Piscinibacter sp.]|jgi:signal transduction histidine kinase|uniref:hypothetical protein n=1 Tax=Piscinibacter sp. TaxID=1903157 RepID=UPI00355978D2